MIFVTGGTGLVGSHLLFRLAENGYLVKALVRDKKSIERARKTFNIYTPNPEKIIDRIEWVEGDIIDYNSFHSYLNDIQFAFHAAAVVSFDQANKNLLLKNNIEGTENIAKACMQHNVEKLCHVSSIAAIGTGINGAATDENCIWTNDGNVSVYSQSKYYSEEIIWKYQKLGLRTVIVNPSVILGPGDIYSGSTALFGTVLKGLKFYTPGIAGFVDVRDVADIMIKLTNSTISGERFILNSENVSYKDLFSMIANSMNKKAPYIKVTPIMGKMAWRISAVKSFLTGTEALITKETVASSFKKRFFSNEKVLESLKKIDSQGKEYRFIPIKQSIDDSCRAILKLQQ